jgi:hypothetical protein
MSALVLQGRQGYVQLTNVTYGASGPFAISFWVKPTQLLGGGLAYLYSHNASMPGREPIKRNQVGFDCMSGRESKPAHQEAPFCHHLHRQVTRWCAGPGLRPRTDTSL